MDIVFRALGSNVRRRILDVLKAKPGHRVGAVCEHFDMSRIAVMKHIAILEEAGLIVSERLGRTRLLYHNPVPIQQIYDRWTTEYSAFWAGRLTHLQYAVESKGKKKWRKPKGSSRRSSSKARSKRSGTS